MKPSAIFQRIGYCVIILLVCVFAFGVGAGRVESAAKYRVGIVRIKFSASAVQSNPFNDAVSGFQDLLKSRKIPVEYKNINLKYGESVAGAFQDLRAFAPDVILTVGTDATIYTQKNFPEVPIIFTMILDPVGSGVIPAVASPGGNVTGVSINISVDDQFQRMQELLPGLKTIGMLYDPKGVRGVSNKQQAETAANRLGLNLVAQPISSAAEIISGLEEALRVSDALWAGPDLKIYNPQSAEAIILTTLRYKKPFMAFDSYVKAGAFIGLTCDYQDIGNQTAELAIKVLNGQDPGGIAVEEPRKKTFLIYREAARRLGIKIPQEFMDNAIIY